MDVQVVVQTLAGTFDATHHAAATQKLSQLETQQGYVSTLLQIITIKEVDVAVRQAAILRLKNIVKQYWTIRKGELSKISDADRKVIRDNIVEAMIWQDVPQIRVQLTECFFLIVRGDFPERWPELMPGIMQNFSSADPTRVHGAVCCLHQIFKKYRFKPADDRQELVLTVFPVIEQLGTAVVQQDTMRAFELQRMLVKIFYLSSELSVVEYLRPKPVLHAWVNLLMKVLEAPLPAGQCGTTPEEMSAHPLWKAKKWVMHIFFRFFTRFGRPNFAAEPMKAFSTMFFDEYAPVCLEACMKILHIKKQGAFVSAPVLQMTYNYIDSAINYSKLYKLLKPSRHFLLLESIFPTLCLQPEDIKLYQEDPHEFVRKMHDAWEDFHDPRQAAINVLINLVKTRTRDCLDMVLSAITQILTHYSTAAAADKNVVHKEAAVRMFGVLKTILIQNKQYLPAIEATLVEHVFPDFRSPVGFLRSRACWCVGMFSNLECADPNQKRISVELVIAALQDQELPVKLEAARAISRLVRNEAVVQHIKPMFPMLLEQFFTLVDEIGNEEVIITLSKLMEHIGDDIAPYATNACQRLVGLMLNLLQEDEEDDEAACTAVQCVQAVNTILYGLEKHPESFPVMEQICAPLLVELLKDTAMEFMDDTIEMITCFTYYPKEISPFMWSVLAKMVEAYHKFAVDYIRDMITPIDNFISKGTEVFVSSRNPDYLQMVLSMVQKAFSDENLKTEAKHSSKILEAILAHCKGRVDHIIPGIIELVGAKLFAVAGQKKEFHFCLLILDVLGGVAYYNPLLFVNIVRQAGPEFEKTLFDIWLSYLEPMGDTAGATKHQKLSVLGLVSLALVPLAQLPEQLRNAFPELLRSLTCVLSKLKANEDEEDEGDDEDDDDDDEDEDEIEVLDIDEENDNESGNYESVAEYTKAIQDNLASILEGNVDPDDYESPLDAVDPFMFFSTCLQSLATTEKAFYQQWTAQLTEETRGTLQAIHVEAQTRAQEKARFGDSKWATES